MAFFQNDLQPKRDEAALLEDLQGNILRGYRQLRARYVFLRFTGRLSDARDWLRLNVSNAGARFAPTTAAAQEQLIAGGIAVNFLVTAEGLRFFDVNVDALPRDRVDPAFLRGSRHEETVQLLNDPGPEQWPNAYRAPWHALVLLCNDADDRLNASVEALRQSLVRAGVLSCDTDFHVEEGHALDPNGEPRATDGPRHEHFGYRDQISEPVFTDAHWAEVAPTFASSPPPAGRDPRRALSVVLAPDPLAPSSFGSYFVFRKLEQDVLAFRERVARYVATLRRKGPFLSRVWASKSGGYDLFRDREPSDQELTNWVLERAMGRSLDGRPLTQWERPEPTAGLNDFDYDSDRGGGVCPFQAHARKMNPRGGTGNLEAEKRRTLARRGIPYGTLESRDGRFNQDVGLLFVCAQRSIGEQFEFVQSRWANSQAVDVSERPTPSIDGFVAQRPRADGHARHLANYHEDRHRKISETIEVDLDFYDLVRFRGGEYLFAPSLSGLRNLVEPNTRMS